MNGKFFRNLIAVIFVLNALNPPCEINSREKVTLNKKMRDMLGKFQGWGGPPDFVSKGKSPSETKPKDYYYVKIESKASQKSIDKNLESMMMSSCRDSALINGTTYILNSFMNGILKEQFIEPSSGVVVLEDDSQEVRYTCMFSKTKENFVQTQNCLGELKNHGVSECWPTSPNDSWATCECLAYVKFSGGKAEIVKKLNIGP